ncbi:Protein Spindly [Geodia barretti]|uniref:Protein Spindly n=1 Tax=Geodia barretti TaxID=519541 RepID=A0AA35T8U5_GEOBA|nr:Protein Spindly [Geodia barretti]
MDETTGWIWQSRRAVRELERELDSLRLVWRRRITRRCGRPSWNEALEERQNQVNKEATLKIEELEQERFSLQQKMECQKAALQAVQHEAESAKADLRQEFEMREEHLKQGHSKKVTETELLLFDLRGENERLETQVKSARDKAAGLEERLREMAEQADSAAESFHLQPEIREMEMMCRQERSEREEAQAQLASLQEDYRLLEMELEEAAGKVERLTDECQERSDQANQWYKTLQASKEQVLELNAKLESLRMERGNSRGSAGNSLFGEVDDRRLQVERKYVSLQVKHDSLEKRHNSMSQQYKRLKAEMSSLLCQFSVVGGRCSPHKETGGGSETGSVREGIPRHQTTQT